MTGASVVNWVRRRYLWQRLNGLNAVEALSMTRRVGFVAKNSIPTPVFKRSVSPARPNGRCVSAVAELRSHSRATLGTVLVGLIVASLMATISSAKETLGGTEGAAPRAARRVCNTCACEFPVIRERIRAATFLSTAWLPNGCSGAHSIPPRTCITSMATPKITVQKTYKFSPEPTMADWKSRSALELKVDSYEEVER